MSVRSILFFLGTCVILLISTPPTINAQQTIGTNVPDASAALEVTSANKGVLLPRMTTAERDAISTPAESLLIYNTTEDCYQMYDGTTWRLLSIAGAVVTGQAGLFVDGSGELNAFDTAGNTTVISPHNFSLIKEGASEEMAWAFYSERGAKAINVDMAKLARTVEQLSGETLIHIKEKDGSIITATPSQNSLQAQVAQLKQENKKLNERLERLERLLLEKQ